MLFHFSKTYVTNPPIPPIPAFRFYPLFMQEQDENMNTLSKGMEDYSNWWRAQTARVQLKIYNFKLISLIQWHDSVFSNTSLVQQ